MQFSTVLDTLDNHTCQRTHLTVGVFLYHLAQQRHTPITIAIVEATHTLDEEELGTVGAMWEAFCRE